MEVIHFFHTQSSEKKKTEEIFVKEHMTRRGGSLRAEGRGQRRHAPG